MKKIITTVFFWLLVIVSSGSCYAYTDVVKIKFPVKLLSGPTFSSATVALLTSGTQLTVIRYENQWLRVAYQGKLGYVAVSWVDGAKEISADKTAIIEQPASETAETFITSKSTAGLMRIPSFQSLPLRNIPEGKVLPVLGKSGHWFEVTFDGVTGYVEERFVTTPQLTSLGLEIATSNILVDLEVIPESAIKERMEKYQVLLSLAPENQEFRKAFDKYQATYEEQQAKEREQSAKVEAAFQEKMAAERVRQVEEQRRQKERRAEAEEQKAQREAVEMAGMTLDLTKWTWRKEGSYALAEGFVRNITEGKIDNIQAIVVYFTEKGENITYGTSLIEYRPLMPGQISPFSVYTPWNPLMATARVTFMKYGGKELSTYQRR